LTAAPPASLLLFRSPSRLWFDTRVFLRTTSCAWPGLCSPGSGYCLCVPTVLIISGAGIYTCSPSATSLDLALGPDLPRADQLYSGILGFSAWRIPTSISLLIPAFSLPVSPPLLIGTASSLQDCSSTNLYLYTFLSFGGVFQPRLFSAQDLSTSELLRTL
jgi:hypothetical protein